MTDVDDWPALAELAERYGVSREYWDWQGRRKPVQVATVQAVLAALDVDATTDESVRSALSALDDAPWRRLVPAVTVGRAGHPVEVLAHVPRGEELTVEVVTESGAVVPAVQVDHHAEPRPILDAMIGEARFVLPGDLPPGYHTLHARSGSGDLTAALFTAHLHETGSAEQAVTRTVSSVHAVLRATLDSAERELRLIAAQAAIASPACEFEVRGVR